MTAVLKEMTDMLIGFDQLFNGLPRTVDNYPPYNIIAESDNKFYIELAVAGFNQNQLSITQEDNRLKVTGKHGDSTNPDGKYIRRGLATRQFCREFVLAQYVEVTDVTLVDGILTIHLERKVPDEKKPKTFEINKKVLLNE